MEQIETSGAMIGIDREKGIIYVKAKPEAEVALADASEIYRACRSLVPKGKVKVIADPRGMSSHRSEARAYFASGEAAELISAMAIIADTTALFLISSFFIRVSKPPYITRMFRHTEEAIDWLDQL